MKARFGVPTVGGEPAVVIYDLIESLPIVIGDDDSIDHRRHFCEAHAAMFQRAYDLVEREFLIEYENCPCGEQHTPLQPGAWRFLVIHAMADRAREALGIHDQHRFWC
jgi:hypothetical protein